MISREEYLSAEFSLKETIFYISSSIVCFVLYNYLATFVLSKFEFLKQHNNFWRFKNTFISWTHALISSILLLINVYLAPELFSDMISVKTRYSYIEISISLGYFIYDAVDIIRSNKKLSSQSYEVLLHHALIIFIFFVPLILNRFVGYTIGAMSIELNTIFLHLRFMLVFNNVPKTSLLFRVVSLINLITFVLFRILILCWMTRWIVLNRNLIHIGWFTVGSIGLAIMMVINIFLLQRLLQADFRKSKAEKVVPCSANESVSKCVKND